MPDPIKLLIWGEMLGLPGPRLRKNLPQAFVITVNYATPSSSRHLVWPWGSPMLKRSPCHSVSQAVCSFRHPLLHYREVASNIMWAPETHLDAWTRTLMENAWVFCDFSGISTCINVLLAKTEDKFYFSPTFELCIGGYALGMPNFLRGFGIKLRHLDWPKT